MAFYVAPKKIPLALYIHLPWCIKKCPYCDFNSHVAPRVLPEQAYIAQLINNALAYKNLISDRAISTIFFGGGTPSLFSGAAMNELLSQLQQHFNFVENIEITLEANPGAVDFARFQSFRAAGINRLSLGVQSFNDEKLKILGRIHRSDEVFKAIDSAKQAGFDNFNLDIMYGLPEQNLSEALHDVETAMQFKPTHFSWYQLTIEPNTLFHIKRPELPDEEMIWQMQTEGQELLQKNNFIQYEVSAYAKNNLQCLHNLNYWQFGDYLGIGAGAHSKITLSEKIMRFQTSKQPKEYLLSKKFMQYEKKLSADDLLFEFMLNALRLKKGVPINYLSERTGFDFSNHAQIAKAKAEGFLTPQDDRLVCTERGYQFLNSVTAMFLV